MKVRLSILGVAMTCAAALVLNAAVAAAQTAGDLSITLSPVGGSGASANANLSAAGNQTNVTVSATGLTPGSTNEAEVHFGTCANAGGIAFSFPVFTANTAGNGSISTTVNASLSSLQDGNHFIHIHVANAAGNVLACGDIPVAAAAATATPRATAVAGATAVATQAATAVATTVATTVATAVAGATATPAALPVTGGPGVPLGPALVLSLGATGLGLFLRRSSRR